MILTKETLKNIDTAKVIVPAEAIFSLPEKILQFGTGVLLRGLPDYFVDKANRQGIFNGRIVIVKSTGNGDTADFDNQDSLYTIGIRGIEDGKNVEENIVSSAISRVISAEQDWEAILEVARNPELKIVVSNTTEVGIQLLNEAVTGNPPASFPGKLLSALYERYKALGDSADAGLVITATELIPENGKKLEAIVYELAAYNKLEDEFVSWSKANNIFCNSLVDRIVPGKPDAAKLTELQTELGYEDQLLILAEPYRLWAVEGNDKVAETLSFMAADKGLIVKPDIEIYRELKVRLLNGTHTLTSGIACLSGIDTVKNGMDNSNVLNFVEQVMRKEIAPAIPYQVSLDEALVFSGTVIDRFANPHIKHLWLSITMQYAMKLKIRVLPVLFNYHTLFNTIPPFITFGFAAFLHFMRTSTLEGGKYYGSFNGIEYVINDDSAAYFYQKTTEVNEADYVEEVLNDTEFWGTDLNEVPGFIEVVENDYDTILEKGITAALEDLNLKLKAV
ncbi:tagaturonate reductase [Pedobacter westerhofensis]|uniref:Tagaturonate reductase n=1 Tax=Pedobacter westerhofensis TaxID=425512 RepID=A0A521D285_9SPHI|nr:tagaturonate reductase [Pedobacter westerhofensis]SMO65815.1 tagaturonate reductase [Pedobacter westerhofensis]